MPAASFFDDETLTRLRENDPQTRTQLAVKLTQAYDHNIFNRQEQQLADDILRVLLRGSATALRALVAQGLKSNVQLPQDIVLMLASDTEDSVACPVLEHSYLLSEEDLVQLVHNTVSSPRLQAIARREAVSAELSGALMDKHLPEVLQLLFANRGAQLEEDAVWQCLSEIPPHEGLTDVLLQREGVSDRLRERLYEHAMSHGMRRLLGEAGNDNHQQTPEIDSRVLSLLHMRRDQIRDTRLPNLVSQLADQGRVTISLLLRSLCIGELALVEYSLARLTGVPVSNMRILLRDRGGRGLRAVYRAAGLPEQYQGVFVSLLQALLHDRALTTLHPRLLKHHLLIAIKNEPAEAVEYATAIIRQATEDLENIEVSAIKEAE